MLLCKRVQINSDQTKFGQKNRIESEPKLVNICTDSNFVSKEIELNLIQTVILQVSEYL